MYDEIQVMSLKVILRLGLVLLRLPILDYSFLLTLVFMKVLQYVIIVQSYF